MIGFVYLWLDSGRHSISHPNQRVFCLGSHCGPENDGYKTSTGGTRFKNAHQKRPQDFKRRIIQQICEGNGRTVLEAEQRWLDLIKPEELRRRYYNRKKTKRRQLPAGEPLPEGWRYGYRLNTASPPAPTPASPGRR